MEMEMRDEYAQRVAERTRNQNAADLKAIDEAAQAKLASRAMGGLGEAGAGAELTAEDVQTLRDNPEAVAAYRKAGATGLLNYSREDELKAQIEASGRIRPDMAKEFRSELKDLRDEQILALNERKVAANEKKTDAMVEKMGRSGAGGADSNGGVEGWQYRQWKQENPSGTYTKFKEWMSDSRYNKDKAVIDQAGKLLSGNPNPSEEEVQAAMNTAEKLVNRKPADSGNGAQKDGKTERPPLWTFFR